MRLNKLAVLGFSALVLTGSVTGAALATNSGARTAGRRTADRTAAATSHATTAQRSVARQRRSGTATPARTAAARTTAGRMSTTRSGRQALPWRLNLNGYSGGVATGHIGHMKIGMAGPGCTTVIDGTSPLRAK